MSSISENLRARREALGMTRTKLARLLDTNETQIRRYETKTSPPAELLDDYAQALNFSVAEILGITPIGLDLTGEWHARWETTRDGIPTTNFHTLNATHSGEFVYLDATGDYDWRADLRFKDSNLTGTYQAVSDRRDERGALYFVLNGHGDAAIGRWSGRWADGILGDGYGVLARDEARADRLIKLLPTIDGPITEWPRET
jgi:transcriptional regulator with XRE-family HTH domain